LRSGSVQEGRSRMFSAVCSGAHYPPLNSSRLSSPRRLGFRPRVSISRIGASRSRGRACLAFTSDASYHSPCVRGPNRWRHTASAHNQSSRSAVGVPPSGRKPAHIAPVFSPVRLIHSAICQVPKSCLAGGREVPFPGQSGGVDRVTKQARNRRHGPPTGTNRRVRRGRAGLRTDSCQ
jgi:hypothetical protein